jgi:hypothetical protein
VWCELDSSSSGWVHATECYSHINETSGSTKFGEFLEKEELSAFREGLCSVEYAVWVCVYVCGACLCVGVRIRVWCVRARTKGPFPAFLIV